jgi:hypothetical protein
MKHILKMPIIVAMFSLVACLNSGCISDEALAAALTPAILKEIHLEGVTADTPVAVIESSACDGSLSVFSLPSERARQDYFLDAMWYMDRQWSKSWTLCVRDVDEAQALAYVRSLRDAAVQQQKSQFVVLMPAGHAINHGVDAIADESQAIEVIVRCLAPESFAKPADLEASSDTRNPVS